MRLNLRGSSIPEAYSSPLRTLVVLQAEPVGGPAVEAGPVEMLLAAGGGCGPGVPYSLLQPQRHVLGDRGAERARERLLLLDRDHDVAQAASAVEQQGCCPRRPPHSRCWRPPSRPLTSSHISLAYYSKKAPGCYSVENIAVDEAYRGRGVGTTLLAAALAGFLPAYYGSGKDRLLL